MFEHKTFLTTVPQTPGVYQMFDAKQRILYVGKAKNLQKRLQSYFRNPTQLAPKTRALVMKIADIQLQHTHTETEALILENTLIKRLQPPYNILLRDDKAYPYLHISADEFPRLSLHRGAKTKAGEYFGPYPHGRAVKHSLRLLQRLFPIRQCDNTTYKNRSRPCLQYQIKRCSAPCVNLVSTEDYQRDLEHTRLFLQGKNQIIIQTLVDKMQQAASALDFEKASIYRDQIAELKRLQAQQNMETGKAINVDVICCRTEANSALVYVLNVRAGRHLGGRVYHPKQAGLHDSQTVLAAFLPQYYLNPERDLPQQLVLEPTLTDLESLFAALRAQGKTPPRLRRQISGVYQQWLSLAQESLAQQRLRQAPKRYRDGLAALALALQLESLPERLECFDISHSLGEATVGSCVVFNQEGADKNAYRRFNIKDVTAGDDYAAMAQALTRHYQKQLQTAQTLPDILFIDGGKGQVKQAVEVLATLNIDSITIVGVAKGADRQVGLETLILAPAYKAVSLAKTDPALLVIQQIRDEAHRFAITGHRQQRRKHKGRSQLQQIEGIGEKRRAQLLQHFGSFAAVQAAGIADLCQIPGIGKALAEKIYQQLRA